VAEEVADPEVSNVIRQLRNELRQTRVFPNADGAWVDGGWVLLHVQLLEQVVADGYMAGNIRATQEQEITAVIEIIRRGFLQAYSAAA
jgi:hypothetical protein